MHPLIHSIQLGPVRRMDADATGEWWDKPWTSGFNKSRASGPVHLGPLGLAGDAQADLLNHGGPDKAVCAYPDAHFPFWRHEPGLSEIGPGAFGENFTLTGLDETLVCIGDVFRAGAATIQISQPRQPCWKLARRWRVKDLALRVEQTGFTGWYFRVIECGSVQAGDALHPLERPHPQWTIAAANAVMHQRKEDREVAARLAACPALSASWRESLAARARGPIP